MKKIGVIFVVVCVIGLVWFFGMGGGASRDGADGKLVVAATVFPAYDIARNIAGDAARVELVLSPGASPHTYEPTPRDVTRLSDARVVFVIGNGLDNWADTIINSTNAQKVALDRGIAFREYGAHDHGHDHDDHGHDNHHHDDDQNDHDDHTHDHEEDHADDDHDHSYEDHDHVHEGDDPHYWLSVENAKEMAQTIAETLISLDPENEAVYRENLETYRTKLSELDEDIRGLMGTVEHRHVILFHESFGYFTDAYGLSIAGVFELSPGVEPTPRQVRNIVERVEEYDIPVLFIEPQLSQDMLRAVARDTGASVEVLDPLGGIDERDSYISLMRYNATVLFESLR